MQRSLNGNPPILIRGPQIQEEERMYPDSEVLV